MICTSILIALGYLVMIATNPIRRYERGDSLADRDPQEKRRQGPSSD